MPRKPKSTHYLYKTTCIITGRYYIGMHSTSNLEDGYLGSGKRLRYSIRKYGKENHVREILEFFDSRELLIEAEERIVTADLLQDKMCMNLREGGTGGFANEEHQKKCSLYGNKKFIEKLRDDPNFFIAFSKKASNGMRKKWAEGKIKPFNWSGKKHDPETIEKIKETKRETGVGSENSQYGSMWITNGIENKKIKKEDIIPDGWYKGRKIKLL